MIPIAVRMRGWMRYRDEQVADFSGARLISICGENGAGKSSIFDAITYALYGKHRLGGQNTKDLIAQDCDLASVDFDFEQAGLRYRAHRSTGRKANDGSQCLYFADDASGEWVPVPGTDLKAGLDARVEEILRMSIEAFTSSFLLTQGGATNFLDARPKERFDIVAALLDLDAYRAIELRARDQKNTERVRRDDAHQKMAAYDGLDEAAVAGLRDAFETAKQAEANARSAHGDATAAREGAQRHATLLAEIAGLDARIEAAARLLAARAEIEADAAAFASLEERLAAAVAVRASLVAAATADAAALAARTAADAIDIAALTGAHESAREQLTAHEAAEQEAARAHLAAIERERAAADFAAQAERVRGLRAALEALAARIAEHEHALAEQPALEAQLVDLRAIADALPLVSALKAAREAAEKARAGDPRAKLAGAERAHEQLATARPALAAAREEAAKASASAHQQAARAEQAAIELEQQRARRAEAAGEATCSRCGQPIDTKQAKVELRELTARAQDAKKLAQAAALDANAAERDAVAATKALDEHDVAARTTERQATDAASAVALLSTADQHDAQAYDAFRAAAPPAIAAAVTESASSKQIAAVYNEHAKAKTQADALAKRAAALQAVAGTLAEERRQQTTTTGELADARKVAGDDDAALAAAPAAHARARKLLASAKDARDAAHRAVEQARTSRESAARTLDGAREEREQLARDADRQAAAAAQHRALAGNEAARLGEGAAAALAEPDATVARITAERDALTGARERLAQLRAAEQQAAESQVLRERAKKDIAAVPEAHRIAPGAAETALATAAASLDAAAAARAAQDDELRRAERALEDLAQTRAAFERADRRHRLLAKLETLLGRNGLQGELVKNALNTITSHANAFLERLTGGTLRLDLTAGRGDEMVLEAIDVSSMREARPVKALSGSQQFRCAVAVASGIGQWAGAGGMRSIVIDEGFGSLDLASQRQFVDELKALADDMDRVIVVSHLEAFQDPDNFPDRLVVERRAGGSSIIRREH